MVAELSKTVDHSALVTVERMFSRPVWFPSLDESLAVSVLPRELSTGERLPLSASGVKGMRGATSFLLSLRRSSRMRGVYWQHPPLRLACCPGNRVLHGQRRAGVLVA